MAITALEASFLYFYHSDKANAAIHMVEVKFSPITFRLAEIVLEANYDDGLQEKITYDAWAAAKEVIADKGKYIPDVGR